MSEHKPHSLFDFFFQKSSQRIVNLTHDFFRLEAAGGILLVLAAVAAILIANSPFYDLYDYILHGMNFHVGFEGERTGSFQLDKSLLHWINDGLMAVFFLLVGLEIKREIMIGELAGRAKALLPVIAAIGGMIAPAGIFYLLNQDSAKTLGGWAIPCATDIAFALGVLSLLGNRVPVSLKVLLTAVAIIDDLGAILIIALFYTHDLNISSLYFGIVPIALMAFMNWRGVASRAPYIILGLILWVAVLKSGVHATMAGVVTAFFIPLTIRKEGEAYSPAQKMEHDLHPWVVFLILPVFAFANAGVPFHGLGLDSLSNPLTLGIIAGLVVGKQLGIFSMLFLGIKSGLCPKPEGTTWGQLYALSVLCGIGFTMSLFIGGLAFKGIEMQADVRLGVLVASLLSASLGYILLRFLGKKQ